MSQNTKAHLKRVNEIVKFFDDEYIECWGDDRYYTDETRYWLNQCSIKQSEYFKKSDLINASPESVERLHGYILGDDENFAKLFENHYAVVVLEENQKFENLNLYLQECFECVKAKRHIAAAILLRACVEILVKLQECEARNLPKGIENLVAKIETSGDFELFKEKQEELKIFFNGMKKIGDAAAHLKKNMKNFVEANNNEEMFKLFCILIEHSILKDEINKKISDEKTKRIRAIDFAKKEKQEEKPAEITEEEISDDDIPF